MQHDRNLIAQRFHIVFAHINAADTDRTAVHIVQAADQVDQTALARACAADDADRLARLDVQVDVGQGVLAAAVLIGEVDVVEVDLTVRNDHDRVFRVFQVRGLIKHFADTADARHRHTDHNDNHGQHHQAHQQGHDVAE